MIAESFGIDFLNFNLPFPCEVHYRFPHRMDKNDNFKVLVLCSEPSALCIPVSELRNIHKFFDLIITSNPSLFDLPNVKKYIFGDIWARKKPSRKEFSTSFVYSVGVDNGLPGYEMRKDFADMVDRIKTPTLFFRGKRQNETFDAPLLIDDKKDCLFESMFHVAIENLAETNYFTEKIIDCFATKTVPVYIGCPNIGDFFDPSGIIIVQSAEEAIDKINGLTTQDYWSRDDAMWSNFEKSKRYWNWLGDIRKIIVSEWMCRYA